MSPQVSIIIPVYNAEKLVNRIATSILKQPFRDFELILINDGSTDNTLETLRNIEKNDSRVRVYTKPNGGPSSARNLGLEKAQGKYIQFYDADDDITPNALRTIVQAIKESKSDLVVSGWKISSLTRQRLPYTLPRELITDNLKVYILRSIGTNGMLYNLWNKLFRTDIIRKYNLRFREDISFGEDVIFAFHYFEHISSLQIIPDVTYYYQESTTGMFSKSALNPEFRHINLEELKSFTGHHNKFQEIEDLSYWVEWRWLLSYWLRIAYSSESYKQKIVYMREDFNGEYVVAKNAKFIGYKKFLMERIANLLRHTPHLTLIGVSILVLLKKLRTLLRND